MLPPTPRLPGSEGALTCTVHQPFLSWKRPSCDQNLPKNRSFPVQQPFLSQKRPSCDQNPPKNRW